MFSVRCIRFIKSTNQFTTITNKSVKIMWNGKKVRTNIKDYINVSLVDKISRDKDFEKSGEIGFLVAGLASKFAEHAVDQYINPEGLSFLIKNSSQRSKIQNQPLVP